MVDGRVVALPFLEALDAGACAKWCKIDVPARFIYDRVCPHDFVTIAQHPHTHTQTGLVDVPFLLGSMGYEGDCCTPRDVGGRNASVSEWVDLMKEAFAPWGQGPRLGEKIASVRVRRACVRAWGCGGERGWRCCVS